MRCATVRSRFNAIFFAAPFQNRRRLSPYLLKVSAVGNSSQEIVMASFRKAYSTTGLVCAAASSSLAALSWAGMALASQGPGTSQGSAGGFTQLAMAVLVYGAAALVVGAGLIGAVRRH